MEKIDPSEDLFSLPEVLRLRYLRLALWWQLRPHRSSRPQRRYVDDDNDDPGGGPHEAAPLLCDDGGDAQGGAVAVQLALSSLNLREVPRALAAGGGSLPPLQRLDLSYNQLLSLALPPGSGSWLGAVPNLTELNVCNNAIRALPREVGRLRRLRVLRAGNNRLSQLPPELRRLGGSLRELYLHANRLESAEASGLEQVLGGLALLEVLDVNYNALVSLPRSLGSCTRLLKLNADNNRLESLLPAEHTPHGGVQGGCEGGDSGPGDDDGGGGGGGGASLAAEAGGGGDGAARLGEVEACARAFAKLGRLQRLYLANNELRHADELARALGRALAGSLKVCDLSCNYAAPAPAPTPSGAAAEECTARPPGGPPPPAPGGPSPTSSSPGGRGSGGGCDLVVLPMLPPPAVGGWGGDEPACCLPKRWRGMVGAGRYLEALSLLCDAFFNGECCCPARTADDNRLAPGR
jgi:hypothetical protein